MRLKDCCHKYKSMARHGESSIENGEPYPVANIDHHAYTTPCRKFSGAALAKSPLCNRIQRRTKPCSTYRTSNTHSTKCHMFSRAALAISTAFYHSPQAIHVAYRIGSSQSAANQTLYRTPTLMHAQHSVS